MHLPARPRPRTRRARRLARVAAVLCGAALVACEPADPLQAIRQQQASGDFAGTIEPLQDILAERPDDPEASYLYGRALVLTGRPSLAMWALRRAMEDPEWRAPAGMQLAHAALLNHDFNEAVDVTTRILEDDPEDAQALLFRAQAHAHWKKDPEAALADARRVLELQPDLLEAYEPLILALLAQGKSAEAREALAEAGARLSETDAPARVLAWHCSTTAIFAADAGEVEEAREQYQECLEAYPADPTVVTNAVEFFDSQGDLESSLAALEAAHAEAPERRDFRTGLADRLRIAGRAGEGEALLREATEEADPRLATVAWSDLARYRHAMGEHGAAADALERAIERTREVEEPPSRLRFQYADALLLSGRLDRALEVAETLSVPAQRRLVRGRVAQERGNPAQALQEFDEAVRLWPDNPSARYYAARAAEQLGDFDRALEEYRYAIRIDVGATDARTRATKLLLAQNQPVLAFQLLFLEAQKAPLDPEGEMLSYYLMARVANPRQLQTALQQLGARSPAKLPMALARAADGAAELTGPRGAVQLLQGAPGLDYTAPYALPALTALVRYAHASDQPEVARGAVDRALAARPDHPAFHALKGLHLEHSGAADAARAAYARALELDPSHVPALLGMGRVTADPGEALELFERASAVDPWNAEAKLGAARSLRASGRNDEAARRLETVLAQHPLERQAAQELVAMDLEAGKVTPRTLQQAQRVARLGGGADAYERLSRIYAELEQPEEAEAAAERARVLREGPAGAGEDPDAVPEPGSGPGDA